MKKWRAVLVGLGQIGCGYDLSSSYTLDLPRSGKSTLTHARALACHPLIDFCAAIDISPHSRMRFSECYQVPTFDSIERFASSSLGQDVDIAVIAVHPSIQSSLYAKLVSLATLKLILLEKPVASSLKQADYLKQIHQDFPKVKLAVNYIRRYLPTVSDVRSRILSGEFGRFIYGNLTYGKGILTNGSHFVNLAEFFLGSLHQVGTCIRTLPFDSFDYEANLTLTACQYPNSCLNIFSLGNHALRAGELDLWFSRGRVQWENSGRHIRVWNTKPISKTDPYFSLVNAPFLLDTEIDHYQHFVIDNLIHHLQNPHVPLKCTFLDGLKTFNLLESILHV